LFVGSGGRVIGPGHFGLLDLGDGVQKFSLHYEADLDRGGASVLDIRPLLWRDSWPVAGENAKEGTYQIESLRTGTVLELAIEGVPVGGRRTGRGGGRGGLFAGNGSVIPPQDPATLSNAWPKGTLDTRMGNYLGQAQQKWTITPVTGGGGYPGSPYFKITITGTDRILAATSEGELAVIPAFTAAPEQLWRLDQLADGSWRIMPKSLPNPAPGSQGPMSLSAVGSSFATLAKFDPTSEKQRWILKVP
jgi:arabinan endo-1,5-alpha-L-arabinosidase